MKVFHIFSKLMFTSVAALAPAFVSAVEVHINSGNPAYPFPQFLEYQAAGGLGNLGTQNAEGVVHAEMEQDIRDAYQVHANEFVKTGVSWGGYDYIYTPYKSAYDCTEGDGYGLLAAAYMGDAITFNGYWMCTHDKRRNRSKTYSGCEDIAPEYSYGQFAIGDTPGGNTAADGDVDVALALYVAYKQWGEFMRDLDGNIVKDACGNPISYKEALIEVLRGLVSLSTKFAGEDPLRVNTGLIGLDGYPKGGDTWNEQTKWSTSNPTVFTDSKTAFSLPDGSEVDVKGVKLIPEFGSGVQQHIDYNAPAYFREFYELFEELGGDPWEIEQFRRGEASSDWLIGKLIGKNQYSVPTAGWCSVSDDGSETSFSNFNQGEDYRCSWRTICNYMWHGNPDYTWDPATHKVVSGGNTFELDAAKRMAAWMNDPSGWNAGDTSRCINYGSIKNMPYSGPATIRWQNDPMTGIHTAGQDFYCSLSMQTGTGSYAAVSAQDYDLMGLVYRECDIKWDTKGDAEGIDVPAGEECNLGKTSNYMHGWARQMGMMVTSGNYPAPSQMEAKPNMKIYRAIRDSITYCYTGDTITYLLDYRNYGSVDAKGVKIVENVPKDFIVDKVYGGGVYNEAAHTITWSIGTVSGYHSDGTEGGARLDWSKANLKATIGQVGYRIKVGPEASGRYCTTADITCTNGYGWTSNEYPNYITATMQRNCVDVVKRSLKIEKSVDRSKINPDNVATFTVKFENSSEAGWIDGGRPRVNVSWAFQDKGNQMEAKFRLFHDAIEPYINYGNYRISYYLYDASVDGLGNGGWQVNPAIYEGGDKSGYNVTHEDVVEGEDSYGKWNQRLCMQFAPLFVTTTMVTTWNTGNPNCTIHRGGDYPLRVVNQINGNNYSDKVVWSDDWSYGDFTDDDEGLYYPISPSWQKLDEKGKTIEEPVTKWLTCGCSEASKTVPNVLVEEYDGYVWRRILGNGPMAGRDVDSVYVRDTLPKGLEFVAFTCDCPLEEYKATMRNYKAADGRDIVEWFIPKMQVKQKGTITYTANVTFPSGADCQTDDEDIINEAWISAVKNSPLGDTALITVTCAKVPDPIVPTTLVKTADKETYSVGDPITYTIEYEQTHGAVFDNAAAKADDWKITNASYNSAVADGTVTLSQGANAKFNYSYASNIFVSADLTVNKGSSTKDAENIIYFRDNIRLGIYINYDGGGSTTLNCYKGTTLLKTATLAANKTEFNIKAELNGSILRMWFDKDTTKLASFTVEDIPTDAGYFGFEAPANGSGTFSNVYVHTDYAYNLSFVDRKPAEVSFVDADNGGVLQGDSIVWTMEQGIDNPIPFGTKYTVTWNGTVDECVESIINVAYAKLLGHADNEIMAQAVTGCGASTCKLEEVTLEADAETICTTDSTVFRATASPKGTYYYQFYLDGEEIGKLSKADTLVAKTAGAYQVKVFATNDPDDECMVKSEKITLAVDTLPVTVLKDTSVCSGTVVKLLATPASVATYKYAWGDGGTTYTANAETEGEYTVAVTNGMCTAYDTAKVTFGSASLSGGIFTLNGKDYDRAVTNEGTICSDKENTLSVNYVADDGAYEWSSKPVDATLVSDGATATFSPTVATTYYVSFLQGCDAIDSFSVVIGDPMKVEVKVDTLCNEVKITASTDGSANPNFVWALDGESLDNTKNYVVLGSDYSKGKVSVYATADDACTSEVESVSFQNVSMTALVDGSATVCPGKTTDLAIDVTTTGLSSAPTYKYQWKTGGAAIDGATEKTYLAGPGEYTVEVSNGICDTTLTHKITEGQGELKGYIYVNDSTIKGTNKSYDYCGTDALTIKTDYVKDDGTDYTWTISDTEGNVISTKTGESVIVTPGKNLIVKVEFSNECDAVDSILINLPDPVEFTIAATQNCESTVLETSSEMANTHYYWTLTTAVGADEYEGKHYEATLEDYPSATGSVVVKAESEGYCPAELSQEFSIDTLSVSLDGPVSVCLGSTADLTATAVANPADAVISYTYAYRKAGSSTAFKPLTAADAASYTSQALTEATEFQVTATYGKCVETATYTVGIGTPARDGNFTVGADAIAERDADGVYVYRTCGGDPVSLSVTHTASDESSFSWTMNGTEAGSGRTITVTPDAQSAAHTEQYIVSYLNECQAKDTINIEVYPLSVAADLTTLADKYCEGESATVNLLLTGYDAKMTGAYIKWTKDGAEDAALAGKSALSFESLKATDSGVYTYEVSNGICTLPAVAENISLTVHPVAAVAGELTYEVLRGNDTTITLNVTPADAEVTWYDGGASVGTGNPYTFSGVTADHTVRVIAAGDAYCSDTFDFDIKVDAKVVAKLTATALAICEGERDTLVVDTTGTGTLLNPKNFNIQYLTLGADGKYHAIDGSGDKLAIKPTLNDSYRVLVTYGKQSVWTDPISITVYNHAIYTVDYNSNACAGIETPINIVDLTPENAEVVWNTDATLSGDGLSVTVNPEEKTTYKFRIIQNDGACVDSGAVTLSPVTAPAVDVVADTTICLGDELRLKASPVTGSDISKFKWTVSGSEEILSSSSILNVAPEESQTYVLEVSNGACDPVDYNIDVKVNELPTITAVTKSDIKAVEVSVLNGSSPYQYKVDNGEYQDENIIYLPTFGVHTYYVKDANGCEGTKVDTLDNPHYELPIVVSPDGDGINDEFTTQDFALAYPDATIKIYDRFGKLMIEYKASDGSWDGTYKGNKCPSTDYWYEISVDEIDKVYTGHFTLINNY